MKGSISGILVLVVAAGAGFGAHRYWQSQPGLRLPWLEKIMPRADVPVCEQPSLEMIESKTKELLQLATETDRPAASQRAASALEQVDRAQSALVAEAHGDQTRLRQVRTAVLHAKFAGARVEPNGLTAPFREFADKLIREHPDSSEAAQAATLQALVDYDPRCAVTEDALTDLEAYAASHSQSHGVRLYCLLAHELVRNGQPASAEDVLRHGLRTYQSTPAAGTLVTQLIDLGFSKAPGSGLTQADWDTMMRAIQVKATARSQNAHGPPRPT